MISTDTHQPAIEAEYRRASQLGAARTIEKLLKNPQMPVVAHWEITGESGTVRGYLALPNPSRASAISAIRSVHTAFGGTVRVRRRPDGPRELAARFDCALWPVELWTHTPASSANWRCPDCDTWNGQSDTVCMTCG